MNNETLSIVAQLQMLNARINTLDGDIVHLMALISKGIDLLNTIYEQQSVEKLQREFHEQKRSDSGSDSH